MNIKMTFWDIWTIKLDKNSFVDYR